MIILYNGPTWTFFSALNSRFPERPPKLRRGQNGLRMDAELTLNRDWNPDWYHSDPKLTACRIRVLSESVLGSDWHRGKLHARMISHTAGYCRSLLQQVASAAETIPTRYGRTIAEFILKSSEVYSPPYLSPLASHSIVYLVQLSIYYT